MMPRPSARSRGPGERGALPPSPCGLTPRRIFGKMKGRAAGSAIASGGNP
ncbi:MAG: hypothetical protein HLUCCA12_08015 [Rhodobacteraceae bacterium HLUCCA12]|nr:MAG: hypothetical protein HLUCCA12_08015 [Rhodobacteraceae bacterium HLUCCA12]